MGDFPLTEPVIRHRGGGRDEDGQLITATDTALSAIAVAPGASAEQVQRARTTEDIVCTVYFPLDTDLVNSDELSVRGERFGIVVNEWRSPWTGRGGLEVLCTRGQG